MPSNIHRPRGEQPRSIDLKIPHNCQNWFVFFRSNYLRFHNLRHSVHVYKLADPLRCWSTIFLIKLPPKEVRTAPAARDIDISIVVVVVILIIIIYSSKKRMI